MKAFTTLDGLVCPLDRANVDTDAIIPKQFLKSIRKTGFGDFLFDEWRYLDHGEPGMDCFLRPKNGSFVLNLPRYQGASILLARENFGCGSSREHAVWALNNYGFQAVIASSYSDIFFNNCFKNGVLPIRLDENELNQLFQETIATEGYRLKINLDTQKIETPTGNNMFFQIDEFRKYCMLNGFDDIALTLRHADEIKNYEQHHCQQMPWLF